MAMSQSHLRRLFSQTVRQMEHHGITFQGGLSATELAAIELRFGFQFPPDLAFFLSFALPVSLGFPNWRRPDAESVWRSMDWPADGICFDIDQNNFWRTEWGVRPSTSARACEHARAQLARAPRLVPVYKHRYIPSEPHEYGNPVLSVYQTDIIYYAPDLLAYLAREFDLDLRLPEPVPIRPVPYWSEWIGSDNP